VRSLDEVRREGRVAPPARPGYRGAEVAAVRPVGRRSRAPRWGKWLALAVFAGALLVLGVLFAWQHNRLPDSVTARLYPLHYEKEIAHAARQYGLDPFLVAAVTNTESGFDPNARSQAGARGLMQLMPATAEWIVSRNDWQGRTHPDLNDPLDNVELGSYYLAYLLDLYGGDRATALAAYNAGTANVAHWLQQGSQDGNGTKTSVVGNIPFRETRGFVDRVERFHALYQRVHPHAFGES
jgi:soluble lytic murein transglycosylase